MPRASVPSTVLARIARVPVVISHEHGSTLDGKLVRRFLDRNVVARGSDAVVVVSRWDRHQMIDVVHMPPSRVRVVPNGIDAMAPTGHDVRAEFGVAPDRALLAVVGRLTAQKCQADLLRAVAYLKAQGRPVSCLLVGDGPDRDALAALAGRLAIEEAIIFTGTRSDVPDVLAALDVAVLCSIWEGLPLAVMEYMAAGAPIVATAVGGVPELIDDGVHGLLVPPSDPVALAGAITRLLDDRRLAQRLGAAGRARQHAEFDLDNTVKRIEQLYLELCPASRRGRRRSVM
jgi:glycosyltransferase involved in cell wall biosynthesis